jgi:hypothetical protein
MMAVEKRLPVPVLPPFAVVTLPSVLPMPGPMETSLQERHDVPVVCGRVD